MKRLNTIIKELVQLEYQLNTYNDEEIQKAIEQYEKNNGIVQSVIIDTIYEGLDTEELNKTRFDVSY